MNKNIKDKLLELIDEGNHVKKVNFVKITDPGLLIPDYISGEEYDLWMNNVKIFASKYCKEHVLYDDIMNAYKTRKNSWGTEAYDDLMSYLNSLLKDSDFINGNDINIEGKIGASNKMIFISHSSLDIDYVNVFVELLEDVGFRGKSLIFCSSVSGYGIPMGKHIYDYLKDQFNKDLHVIYVLSENYYNSPACLNEMGAAWVKSKKQTAILTPEFNYNQIKGAIDASRIWVKLNDKYKINEFKDELINEFELKEIENDYWERRRDRYIEDIDKIYEINKYKTSPQIVELEGIEEGNRDLDEFKCFFRLINKTDKAVKCTFIQLLIEDKNGGKIKITLNNHDMNNLIIYNSENKRVEINITRMNYEIISSFNPYLWNKYEIVDSGWSKIL